MSKYHSKTLEMLGLTEPIEKQSNPKLINWAKKNNIEIPESFLEWSSLDGGKLLEEYSNGDFFYFEEPEIIKTNQGHGLLFHSESQGNFNKLIILNKGEDPPVLWFWYSNSSWVLHAERFSDCVFGQIFQWQYLVSDNSNKVPKIYNEFIKLKTASCIDILRKHFTELIILHANIEDDQKATEYFFWKSPKERIYVFVINDAKAQITISGEYDLATKLEVELLNMFKNELIPHSFNSVGWATSFLDEKLNAGLLPQIKYACINKPTDEIMESLITCHQKLSLKTRAMTYPYISFPDNESEFVLGGSDWGILIYFCKVNDYWWSIEKITKA
jgi:hypothetical protein